MQLLNVQEISFNFEDKKLTFQLVGSNVIVNLYNNNDKNYENRNNNGNGNDNEINISSRNHNVSIQ